MSETSVPVRITTDATELLRQVTARFPHWAQGQLASLLIVESCKASLGQGPVLLPTVQYLRAQLGLPTDVVSTDDIRAELDELRSAVHDYRASQLAGYAHRLSESAPAVKAPQAPHTSKAPHADKPSKSAPRIP